MRLRTSSVTATCAAVLLGALIAASSASAQVVVHAVRRPAPVVRPYYPVYRAPYYAPWYYAPGFAFGVSFGFGYPWYPGFYYGGYPGYYGYAAPYYGYPYYYDLGGSLRLQVKPREAEVFVNGYYAGKVDDFDGTFQRLNIQPGEHEVELYLPGHKSVQQKVYLQPGKTSNIKLEMAPLGPNDPQPTRPVAPPPPQRRDSSQAVPRRPSPATPPRDANPPADTVRNANPEYGSLALRVQPGDARIKIDGEMWEHAADDDRLTVELSTGRHVIEIEKDGYRRYITEVTVRGGETASLNVALTRQ